MPKQLTSEEYFIQIKEHIISKYSEIGYRNVYFIGIDTSLLSTGIAIVKDGELIEKMTVKGKNYGAERVYNLATQLVNIISSYNPRLCFIEEYAFSMHDRSVTGLAELQGTLQFLMYFKKYDFLKISPTTVKKYVIGGQAKKDLMMMAILKKFGIECSTTDEADAVGLANLIFNTFKFAKHGKLNYTNKEIETFQSVLKNDKKKRKTRKTSTKQLSKDIID